MAQQRPVGERRKHDRYPLAAAVQFYHLPSKREYAARSVDVSAGGLLMYVPVGTPVAPGQAIEVTMPLQDRPELASLAVPIDATIVRVDRHKMVSLGCIPVGVSFSG